MTTTKWVIDPTHSEIQFKIKHLMISTVTGHFTQFDASIEMEGDDLTSAKIRFSTPISSITTHNDQRDAHLKAGDFFDIENHPTIDFEGGNLEKLDDENYVAHGTLTIKGVARKVSFEVEYGGVTLDPWGNTRTGFSLFGKINRKDFGVGFSVVTETGGLLLGEEVKISANTEFVRQADTVAA